MFLMGATICNAQTQKIKPPPVKPVPGQTPPQAPPKKPAPQTAKTMVTDSTNNVDSIKSRKIKPKLPPSLGIEKEFSHPPSRRDTPRKPRFPWRS